MTALDFAIIGVLVLSTPNIANLRNIVKLAGVLGTNAPTGSLSEDPIADALAALRDERAERFDAFDASMLRRPPKDSLSQQKH